MRSAKYTLSMVGKKLWKSQPDISCDFAKQDWRQISATMHRYRCRTAILMTELFVRTSLANFPETRCG